jgi:dUTP pyrophosphatase
MIREVEIIRLRENATIPTYGSDCSAGLDLYACLDESITIHSGDKSVLIPTGISINMMPITEACVGLIFPRSGLGHKDGVVLGNSTGVIDQDYHGEIFVSLWNRNNPNHSVTRTVKHGDRIAQLVIVPIITANFKIVDKFSVDTQRGSNGFGSTGV